ncbi:uncharacterized protein LOC100369202 [Saccoglossus kowalevskii]|uniref:Mitotic spindle assembly checkpoint protein MAD1-like n=1 Tax=Saccoglossus kowalevskii TaxID=10224 RepID=A0ABM0GZQ6_SACKO|nr:PREDICTED: mitotic spindle assembly checkpoint protein MAD1-like [Saccoglossus kowalevskii]
MMSRDWESKFSSIVRETEANLAKVRQRLGSSRSSIYDNSFRSYSPKRNISGTYGVSHSSPTSSYPTTSSPEKTNLHTESADPSPALIAILNEKIEQQGKLIDNLSKEVQLLEKERDGMRNRMERYEDQLRALDRRLSEKGIDLQTERKIELWRREMKTELYEIQSKMHSQRASADMYGDDMVSAISRELRESKTLLQEECDSLRRDIESIKTKLLNQEVDIASQLADTKNVSRKVERLGRNVNNITESHRSHNRDLNDTLQSNQSTQKHLTQIRAEMEKLLDSVTRIEARSCTPGTMKSFDLSNGDIKLSEGDYIGKKYLEPDDLCQLSLSDLDVSTNLSDFQTDPSSKPKLQGSTIMSDPDSTIDLDDLNLSGTPSISSLELDSDLF